jgi:hypothetical protein
MSAVVALIGVALGALLSFLGERQRDRRATKQQMRVGRQLNYAAFFKSVSSVEKEVVRLGRVIAADRSAATNPDDLRHPDRVTDPATRAIVVDLERFQDDLVDHYENLKLIAPDAIVCDARVLVHSMNDLVTLARSGLFDTEDWNEVRRLIDSHRSSLRTAARADISDG